MSRTAYMTPEGYEAAAERHQQVVTELAAEDAPHYEISSEACMGVLALACARLARLEPATAGVADRLYHDGGKANARADWQGVVDALNRVARLDGEFRAAGWGDPSPGGGEGATPEGWRRFNEYDWNAFGGAEGFSDGRAPLCRTITFNTGSASALADLDENLERHADGTATMHVIVDGHGAAIPVGDTQFELEGGTTEDVDALPDPCSLGALQEAGWSGSPGYLYQHVAPQLGKAERAVLRALRDGNELPLGAALTAACERLEEAGLLDWQGGERMALSPRGQHIARTLL